jgi:hypothetical protein
MVEDRVELVDVPILFLREQWRNQDEGEVGIAIGDLRRTVRLDPRDIAAPLSRSVKEQQEREFRAVFLKARNRRTLGDEELIFVAARHERGLRVLARLRRRRRFERPHGCAARQQQKRGERTQGASDGE